MASRKRINVIGYAGIFYTEIPRTSGRGLEKIYYIRYRKDGKLIEEKVGGQYKENMSPAKASTIRANRIEGIDISNNEKRIAIKEARDAELNRFTIERLWNLFAEDRRGIKTLDDDRTRYNLHIDPYIGLKTVDELTIQDIDKVRRNLEKKGRSPQTIKHVLTLIKRIFNFALNKGYVEFIPAKLQNIQLPRVDNKVTENLTHAQIKTLLEVLDNQKDQNLASIMKLALYTGMRKTALLNLKWTDLDFENSFITLRGETAKKGKTEMIPMNAMARDVLEKIERSTSEYIFANPFTGKPRENIAAFLRKVRKEANLPDNFRPLHGLRHAFASLLASSGQVSMYELQKLLTHSNPNMTQRYAHLHDEALKKASNVTSTVFANINN